MRLRKSVTCSAIALALAAFGAQAQTTEERDLSVTANPNAGVDANVGISNTDVNAGTDMDARSRFDQSASTYEKERHGKAFGHDEDKKTGLDRADEAAGEHGEHGRDNARAKQGG